LKCGDATGFALRNDNRLNMHWIEQELDDRVRHGLYRVRRRLQSAQGARVCFRNREFVNFSSNDYLNLAGDPRLARAAAWAARRYGCGAGASALVSGHLPPLRSLERALAEWEGTEAALVFSSGFAANLGVLSALAGKDDALFSDELNHASLIDGCRLARAALHVYRHGDVEHLQQLLQSKAGGARRRIIVTDTVFSMDGDFAPLTDLLALARRFDCLVLVDEAHATGVLGEEGRGLTELTPDYARESARVIKVGTLSKALGAQGGFVCGSRELIEWLVNTARPYVFSTALAPPLAAAARRAVALVRTEPDRRQRLMRAAELLHTELKRADIPTTGSACQIVPVIAGSARAAVKLSKQLEKQGLIVPAIRPPSVPEGTARLRISLCAGHTEDDVRHLVDVLKECR
jgi:8-amino-7-oxononanoate synthase